MTAMYAHEWRTAEPLVPADEAEVARRMLDLAQAAVEHAQAAVTALAQRTAQAAPAPQPPGESTELLVTVEAARRLALAEQTVRRLLDQHPACRRTFGRAVRVYWPAMAALLAEQRTFQGDESRPFPRDIAGRRPQSQSRTRAQAKSQHGKRASQAATAVGGER